MKNVLQVFTVGLITLALSFGLISVVSADPLTIETITVGGNYVIGENSTEISIGTELNPATQGVIARVTSGGANISFAENIKSIYTGGIAIQVNDSFSVITIPDNFTIKAKTGIMLASSANKDSKIVVGDYLNLTTTGIAVQGSTNARGRLTFGDHTTITTSETGSKNSHGATTYVIFEDYTTITVYNEQSFAATNFVEFGDHTKLVAYGKGSYGAHKDVDIGDYLEVYTYGENSFGLNTNVSVGDNAKVITEGKNARGAANGVTLGNNSYIETKGENAIAAFNGVEFGDNATILTHGNNAYGAYNYNDNLITFGDNANITTKGIDADAFIFFGNVTKEIDYNNITATSELANLVGNSTTQGLNITFTGDSDLYGNLYNYSDTNMVVSLKDDTTWEGQAIKNEGLIELNLYDNVIWSVNNDSDLTTLNMAGNSGIQFVGNNYYSLEVDNLNELLDNNNLTLSMRVDMSEEESGDKLLINKAVGEFNLNLSTTGTGEGEFYDLIIIEDGTEFNLNHEKEYGIGLNTFELLKTGDSYKKIYTLKRTSNIDPVIGIFSANMLGLIQSSKAFDDIITLQSIKKNTGVFGYINYKTQNFDEIISNFVYNGSESAIFVKEFEQNLINMIIGFNVKLTNNFTLGAFVGRNNTKQLFSDGSNSKIVSNSIGLQVLTAANFDLNTQTYIRFSNYEQNYTVNSTGFGIIEDTAKADGLSLSFLVSYDYLTDNSWIIRPFGRIFYSKIGEYAYKIKNTEYVSLTESGLQYYLGIGAEKSVIDGENTYTGRLDIAWIRNSGSGYALKVNDTLFIVDLDRDQLMLNGGFELGLTENSTLSFDLNFKYGKTAREFGFTFAGSIAF